jgi:histidinol phosphatase-like enzyme
MLITPYDLLLPAGEPVTLEVEVEHRWATFIDPPMADVEVEIIGVGRARSGTNGIASFPLGVLPEGLHRHVVWVGRRMLEVLVRIVPKDAPILVVDIDHTIADVSPQGFIFRRVKNVKSMPGSREALKELSKSFQILYLSARDHIFTRKTKLWLRLKGFPEAPVYLRKNSRFWSASPREHKLERLKDLRAHFPNIPWGVGDKPGDVAAYAAHGIKPILIAEGRPTEVATEVPCFRDWKLIVDYIRGTRT